MQQNLKPKGQHISSKHKINLSQILAGMQSRESALNLSFFFFKFIMFNCLMWLLKTLSH